MKEGKPDEAPKQHRVIFRLTDAQMDKLNDLTAQLGRSKSEVVRELVASARVEITEEVVVKRAGRLQAVVNA